ncbi:MAG TPA: tRNA (adenosine(37)-N6)-threonylcarbamoyltransferase complex transferase subunit TsaD [Moorella mulderi]|nr:tRNA (adenosine(37)-N6)-threonylcarbamoyltransferase complex transferase subunit TsaD [Moorella mulderi]
MMVLILGIETSCDETSAAVVRDGQEILSNVVASQIEIHRRYGGVVPEIASRHHMENIGPVVEEALQRAGVHFQDLHGIAVTHGPGLVGALLVGVSYAKAAAFALQKPLMAVHHLLGHIYAAFLSHRRLPLPAVALIVSGGHTELVYMEDHGKLEILGSTRDDAAGEAFDKVARVLGLPYPGGPELELLAQGGDPEAIKFPRAWLEEGSLDFSFSGLKTAVINHLRQAAARGEHVNRADVAASFQEAVVDVLVGKSIEAARRKKARSLLLVGGVAANRRLRSRMEEEARKIGLPLFSPPLNLCTDNAAMIACAGYYKYLRKEFASWDLNAYPSLPLA